MGKIKFIYAIIENKEESHFDIAGLNEAMLEAIPYRDLIAVVSPLDAGWLEGRDEERLKSEMIRYQMVNLTLLKNCTVAPMRFGLTAINRENMEEVLSKAYLQLRMLLKKLEGKIELVLQASWDLPQVLNEMARSQGNTIEKSKALSASEVLEIGRSLFEAAEVRRSDFIEVIHSSLSSLSIDYSDGPLKNENMIFNRSYLVEKDKELLFDEAINRLGAGHNGRLNFRYIGPLPAYSFTNIDFSRGNFAEVDWARQTLRLPQRVSWCLIKDSYRSIILANHPDRNPYDAKTAERCKEAIKAYEILEAYCRSYGSSRPTKEIAQYSFAKEDVEEIFVMRGKVVKSDCEL